MTRALAAAALAMACAVPAARAGEVFARGDVSLRVSGSVRQLFTWTRGTEAESFEERVQRSLPSPNCLSTEPAAFVRCPFFELPADLSRLEAAVDAALQDTLDALDCLRAAGYEDCAGFDAVGERGVWQSLTRLRTRLDLRLGERVSATVVYDHEFHAGRLDTLEGGLSDGLQEDTFLGAEDDIELFGLGDESSRRRWRHLLYRATLRYQGERLEVSVGRQRLAWGVARLWNPIDRFSAIRPLAIERDQSVGVDSVDVRWLLDGFSYLQAVYAPGVRSEDALYALRLHGFWRDLDYSVMAGVFEEARTVGLDLAGNAGEFAVRLEAVYTDPSRDVWRLGDAEPRELPPYWQAVLSVDRSFDVGRGLYVLLEHLYNGNALGFGRGRAGNLLPAFEATDRLPPGLPAAAREAGIGPFVALASADVFGGSRVVTRAEHTTGAMLSYAFADSVRGDLIALYDWDGSSAAFVPSLVYTGFSFAEIGLGAQLFVGGDRSEFGASRPLAFLRVEFFY